MSKYNKIHKTGGIIKIGLDMLTNCDYNIIYRVLTNSEGGAKMQKLAKLREKNGLTQKELAEITGISTSSIAMYETGERRPTLRRAKLLADFFGISIEDIFFTNNAHNKRANTG